MVLKRLVNQLANICGNVVLNITPFSDWFVFRPYNRMMVPEIYLPLGLALGTGKFMFYYFVCNILRLVNKTVFGNMEILLFCAVVEWCNAVEWE